MARFFIDRPIFAWVIAIVVMLAGVLSIAQLALEQYPDIAPTRVAINATYTGASAKTVEDSVTQVIEQRMQGLDNLLYIASTSSSSGSARVQLTFEAGTDPDTAQMQVQNKLQQAMSQLPQSVQSQGIRVTKSGSDLLLIVSMVSRDGSASATDIADYIASNLVDIMSRLDGVGEVFTMGSAYAMRIWLEPEKLKQYALMPADIRLAVQAQNTEVSAGQIGALPALSGQQLSATITARSKLQTVEEFQNIVLKVAADGAVVRLGDVARVELGSESYNVRSRFKNAPAASMGIRLATGANALAVADLVKNKVTELAPFFPNGMEAAVSFDTTPFVRVSIDEVVKTLVEAIILVVLIMYVFLQNWRATLIPAIAVPVVLLGTFGILAAFGYTINTLTMFGVVLAIGLLVDDAIVVVENVERIMTEQGLSAREATRQSMQEITGALIGIALVLSAVFIPMAFFGGSTGVIYRQFSITIVSAMLLSVLVALTLTPALCATLLKPVHRADPLLQPDLAPSNQSNQLNQSPPALLKSQKIGFLAQLRQRFFDFFNRNFERNAQRYQAGVAAILRARKRSFLVYLLLVGAMAGLFMQLPTSFLPDEDQGILTAMVKMPPGATRERLEKTVATLENYLSQQTEVAGYNVVMGMDGEQGNGSAYISLKHWDQRQGKGQNAGDLARKFTRDLRAQISDASVFILLPPAVRGLGANAGFAVQMQDIGSVGFDVLLEAQAKFIQLANERPELSQVRTNNLDQTPQFSIVIDDAKAGAYGLSTSSINDTLSSAMGGSYINDFINQGRIKKVYMQGDAQFRMSPDSINGWYVRNANSEMVPFSAFASTEWTYGSAQLTRYNGMPSFELVGDAAAGVSSGRAMAAVEAVMQQMPVGIGYEWTGQSYQERESGAQAPLLYALSILFIFLCLAALYESWSIPFSVMMAVPLGILGALLATSLAGLENDVYFQVGLLATVGLSAKNAILIVEFAKLLQAQGMSAIEATLKAAHQRLRPIVMTSLAFGFGVLPLAFSNGAGSGSRQAIGVGVLGGITSSTVLGIFFVPLFFVLIQQVFNKARAAR